jgi:ribosome-associated protein
MTKKTTQSTEQRVRQFAMEAASLMRDLKCEDVVLLDVRTLSQVCDYVIVGSGSSDRQMQSVARDLKELGDEHGERAFRINQDKSATWVVVDFIDVVAHIFEPGQREYYDIEGLWSDAPQVDWKAGVQRKRTAGRRE